MAAPMNVSGGGEAEKKDEEIDVLSPNFNPLKALYASNVALPVSEVSVFNNLAEYERFMSKSGEEPKAQEQNCAPLSRRALERRHLEHMREKEKLLPKSTSHKKNVNVLSRMESHETRESPLDLLRQCVEKRCKVRVCIRSFKGLRSICIGYLVAFDKIWNMALSDVVEIYKRPSTGKRFHHEEKVTYSMIMSNLNPPPPKKPDPPKPSAQEQKATDARKRAKECKFCRIKHEALMEERARRDLQEAEVAQDQSASESSSSDTDEYSTTDDSECEGGMEKGNMKKGGKKLKMPKKISGLCPNGHRTPRIHSQRLQSSKCGDSKSGKDSSICKAGSTAKTLSSVNKKITPESSDSLWTSASSSHSSLTERDRVSTKDGVSVKEEVSQLTAPTRESKISAKAKSSLSSASLNMSDTRKSDLLLSRMTTPATKQESSFAGSTLSSHTITSSTSETSSAPSAASRKSAPPQKITKSSTVTSSSLSQAFSKSLKIGRQSEKPKDTKSREDQEEVVHLDPKTGKRLIQPEEFKRRHVNQLFIRGDQVVLVSVESDMVVVDLKKAVEKLEAKSSAKSKKKENELPLAWR
ncbi:uncharacterized protein LOC121423140 [Lytechinus variegatus]|uniref:uncharacterized protein LOC121423140 n=1 Tax=Lytechinus variegatus TaxID=7654 RepID=UPI001BB10905|nr:uncharacterized protein LOC121423140 [Lytechinus variegatus]